MHSQTELKIVALHDRVALKHSMLGLGICAQKGLSRGRFSNQLFWIKINQETDIASSYYKISLG